MAIVVDSSVAACWLMPDEFSEFANGVLDAVAADGMLVPPLFWYELRNVLLINERRHRIAPAQIEQGLLRISSIAAEVDMDPVEASVFQIARRHQLTIYDAAYLEIATRTRSPLATLDGKLIESARSEKVAFIPPGP